MIPPFRLRLPLFLVLALLAPIKAVAQQAPVDLGTLGGTFSAPRAVNDIGEVVGESTIGPGTARHAFLWTATGGIVDLGTLGGANSVANDVNAFGQVVGVSQTTMAAHAFLWTVTGGMLDLGTLGGWYSEAVAVNDHGQVVGSSDTSVGRNAFLWTATGGMADLGTLGGRSSKAVAVNDYGHVVGSSETMAAITHAFAWTPRDGMVDLGTLGGSTSYAEALNNGGAVVGRAETVEGGVYHAFLWTAADGMVDLGTLGGVNSAAYAVNEQGQVVGWSQTPGNTARHAFMWTPAEGMVDLGTLGGTNSWASAVSSSGHIVGASAIAVNTALHAVGWTAADGLMDLGPLNGDFSEAFFANNIGQVVGVSWHYDPSVDARATMWVLPGVSDATPPTLILPTTIVVDATSPAGAIVTYAVSANDDVDPNPFVVCSPSSGSVFPLLTTTITCTATDTAGNSVSETFDVIVQPAAQWTVCASEGGVCAFTGTRAVRYGVNGAYVYKTLSDGTACTNSVFGDPAFGIVKSCAVESDWTFCASEGGVCAFSGTQEVRYGASGSYFYQTLSDGTACTNSVFGDPVYGTPKRCDIRPAAALPTNQPPTVTAGTDQTSSLPAR